MCLHAICQPVVNEAQAVIRHQRDQLDRCAQALDYLFLRLHDEERLRQLIGAGTETFERLTAIQAEILGTDVDLLRDQIIPGSAGLHRARKEDEA